jgi:hypothetical protein
LRVLTRTPTAALLGAALGAALRPGALAAQPAARPVAVEAARATSTATVRGRVVDAVDGRPVAAALVALRLSDGRRAAGAERVARTDGEGRFAVAGVPAGAWTLVVRRLGYAPGERRLRLPEDSTAGDVRLAPAPADLAELVVSSPGRARSADDLFQPAAVSRAPRSTARSRRASPPPSPSSPGSGCAPTGRWPRSP